MERLTCAAGHVISTREGGGNGDYEKTDGKEDRRKRKYKMQIGVGGLIQDEWAGWDKRHERNWAIKDQVLPLQKQIQEPSSLDGSRRTMPDQSPPLVDGSRLPGKPRAEQGSRGILMGRV